MDTHSGISTMWWRVILLSVALFGAMTSSAPATAPSAAAVPVTGATTPSPEGWDTHRAKVTWKFPNPAPGITHPQTPSIAHLVPDAKPFNGTKHFGKLKRNVPDAAPIYYIAPDELKLKKRVAGGAPISQDANSYSSIKIDRTGWTAYADSSQSTNPPSNAINNLGWQTEFSPVLSPLPHWFSVNMQQPYVISGIAVTPRQDGSKNGNIGQHIVEVSLDAITWTLVARGTWADDQDVKNAWFAQVPAQYVRITMYTEAGNRGPWSSILDFNVLQMPRYYDRSGWTVSADSYEVTQCNNCAPSVAISNDWYTNIWHTAYDAGNSPAYPHWYMIDMGTAQSVGGMTYRPRALSSGPNGRVGKYQIQYNTNYPCNQAGTGWTTVAMDNTVGWADDATLKWAYWTPVTARCWLFIPLSEAGNRGPWASMSQINLINPTYSWTAPSNTLGKWGPTINFPSISVAAATTYDGNLLIWSSNTNYDFNTLPKGQTVTCTYNPSTGIVSSALVSNTGHDMFCPGIATDFNGNVLVTGGDNAQKTSSYNAGTASWTGLADMQMPRGYQSQTTLSNGGSFTIGGSWSGALGYKFGEIYDPTANTWTNLTGCDPKWMLTNDWDGIYRQDNHAWLFAWSNQYVLQAGPSNAMNWYGTTGTGSRTTAGARSTDPDAMNGNAVMYDISARKILHVGGSPDYINQWSTNLANILTIPATIPGTVSTTTITAGMNYPRMYQSATILPNGQTFIYGGQSFGLAFSDEQSVMVPEIYDPTSNTFTAMNVGVVPRNYHGVGLLMADATVFVGGGGLCGDGCVANHMDGQIFSPPYLFTTGGAAATRPTISAVSNSSPHLGNTITITTGSTPAVTSFSLVRMGSFTHTVNTDQRRYPFNSPTGGPTSWTITIPTDAGKMLPGYWYLFAMTSAGVPSVAKIIKVQP